MAAKLTKPVKKDLMDGLHATSAVLDGAKLMLFKNDYIPDQNTVLADLVPCNFTGYTPYTLAAWGESYVNPDGQLVMQHPSKQFTPADDVTPNVAYGYGITNTAGTVLLAATTFDTPVTLTDNDDAVIVYPELIYGQ